jgi:hypothetical protein
MRVCWLFLFRVDARISRQRSGVFTNKHEDIQMRPAMKQPFPPIEEEARSHVGTSATAFYLNRKDQTLRSWASLENGPLRPVRINGRLAWAVADIKRLLKEGV